MSRGAPRPGRESLRHPPQNTQKLLSAQDLLSRWRASAPLELGGPLLQKRPQPLFHVARRGEQAEVVRFEQQALVERHLEPLVHGFQREPDRERAHGERSEEHTSELQSLAYLVCRLLLEKKKKKHTNAHTSHARV